MQHTQMCSVLSCCLCGLEIFLYSNTGFTMDKKTVKHIFVLSLRHRELNTNCFVWIFNKAWQIFMVWVSTSAEQVIKALIKITAFCNLYFTYLWFTVTSCKADRNTPLKFSSKVLIYNNNEKIKISIQVRPSENHNNTL